MTISYTNKRGAHERIIFGIISSRRLKKIMHYVQDGTRVSVPFINSEITFNAITLALQRFNTRIAFKYSSVFNTGNVNLEHLLKKK